MRRRFDGSFKARVALEAIQYLAGLERVANLKPDLLLESHFGIFETESVIADFIDECRNPRPEPCKC